MRKAGIDRQVWRQHAWLNGLQSLSLLALMGGFLALLGWLLWGGDGMLVLLLAGAVGVMFNPTFSPRWVMSLYGASRIAPESAPTLAVAVARLAERAHLPAHPVLYYVPSRMLNAFAVGNPRQSAIAVTDGLLRQLDLRELVGVLAHEMSHIRNNDLWVMGLADMFSRTTSILSLMGQLLLLLNIPLLLVGTATINLWVILLLILAPTLSAIAQLALARTREYDADLNAAWLTGDPEGLARALLKIEQMQGGWLERIFLPGRRVPDPSLLRSHPKTSDRVERLISLRRAGEATERMGLTEAESTDRLHAGHPVSRPPRWHVTGLWH